MNLDNAFGWQKHLIMIILILLIHIFVSYGDSPLSNKGGKRLVPVGLRDDDQCIEDDFTAWKEQLWPKLDLLLRDEDDLSSGTIYTVAVPEYRVVFIDHAEPSQVDKSWNLENGNVVHDIQHPCRYETGDHVGMYVENSIETVEMAENLLNYSSDTYFSIHNVNGDGTPLSGGALAPPFPSSCTLRIALTSRHLHSDYHDWTWNWACTLQEFFTD